MLGRIEIWNTNQKWIEILPPVPLKGNSHHLHKLEIERSWTHIRLNIYPDGGIARLRVYGDLIPNWDTCQHEPVDLVAIKNGGWLVDCSDQHWGSPANIIYPGTGKNMGEGWETRRRRKPGKDYAPADLNFRHNHGVFSFLFFLPFE